MGWISSPDNTVKKLEMLIYRAITSGIAHRPPVCCRPWLEHIKPLSGSPHKLGTTLAQVEEQGKDPHQVFDPHYFFVHITAFLDQPEEGAHR